MEKSTKKEWKLCLFERFMGLITQILVPDSRLSTVFLVTAAPTGRAHAVSEFWFCGFNLGEGRQSSHLHFDGRYL